MKKDVEFVKNIVDGTNWELLQSQKDALIEIIQYDDVVTPEQEDLIGGLISFLERIQKDVAEKYLDEKRVFGDKIPDHMTGNTQEERIPVVMPEWWAGDKTTVGYSNMVPTHACAITASVFVEVPGCQYAGYFEITDVKRLYA